MTASRSLYLLTEDADALRAIVDEYAETHDGDITDVVADIEALWASLDASIERKTEACVRLVREWEATANARREEARRLEEAARADEARASRLKAYMLDCLQRLDRNQVKAGPYTVSVCLAGGKPPLVVNAPLDTLPERFRRVTVEVDKDAIRKSIEAGDRVPGCYLGERSLVLRVR